MADGASSSCRSALSVTSTICGAPEMLDTIALIGTAIMVSGGNVLDLSTG